MLALLRKILQSVIGKMKGMGFLEWVGLASVLGDLTSGDLGHNVAVLISDEIYEFTGMRIDPAQLISDAGISAAVSERVGFTIRTLKNKQSIKEDLENHALEIVSQRSGYQLHSITDAAILKNDMVQIGSAMLSQRLGIPAGVLPGDGEAFDAPAIKERLLAWAKAELMTRVEGDARLAIADFAQIGDIEALAVELNGRLAAMGSDEAITARQMAVYVSNKMAVNAVADYGRVAVGMSKRTRRQLQLRDAQQKFRAAHGNRQKYVPLGMHATIG
ncbi:MAG: hypothetical protein ACOYB3_07275 [Azonexus sp.]